MLQIHAMHLSWCYFRSSPERICNVFVTSAYLNGFILTILIKQHGASPGATRCITRRHAVHHQAPRGASPGATRCITRRHAVHHQAPRGASPGATRCITTHHMVHHHAPHGASTADNIGLVRVIVLKVLFSGSKA